MPVVAGVLLAAGSGMDVSRADGGGESVGPGHDSPLSADNIEIAIVENSVTSSIDPTREYQGKFPDGFIADEFQERDVLDGDKFFSTGAENESGMERMNIWIIHRDHIQWQNLEEVIEGDELFEMRSRLVKVSRNTVAKMITQIFSDRVGIRLTWSASGKSYLLSGNFAFTNFDRDSQVINSEGKMINVARSTLPIVENRPTLPPATPY